MTATHLRTDLQRGGRNVPLRNKYSFFFVVETGEKYTVIYKTQNSNRVSNHPVPSTSILFEVSVNRLHLGKHWLASEG